MNMSDGGGSPVARERVDQVRESSKPIKGPSLGGVGFLAALAAVLGASIWLDQSRFLPVGPFDDLRSLRYYLCSPSRARLAGDVAGVALALFAIHSAVQWRLFRRRWSALPAYEDVRYFWPLALVGLNLTALGVFSPSLRDWWAPVAYVAMDLRLVVRIAAIALFVMELDRVFGHPVRAWRRRAVGRLSGDTGRLYSDAGIAAAAVAVVLASSPALRFSSIVVGDEPKYLRFCENWSQGLGMNVEGIQDLSAIPFGEPSRFLKSVASLGPALRRDVVSLAADAKYIGNWKHWRHRFNRTVYTGNAIVRGKNGGLYQMHNPGISAIIFPAYAVDRAFFDRRTARFADDLFSVNLAFLTMFALVAVATWRLARAIAPPVIAATAALAVVLSLPVGAFPFQFYPEMMGALVVCVIGRHLVAPAPLRYGMALVSGFLLGLLGWMHVRYLGIAAVGVAWIVWTNRRERGPVVAALSVFSLLTAALCLYAYHVSGSIVPTAIYLPEDGNVQFAWSTILRGTIVALFDRRFGLVPLAPMLLLALPGFGLMLRRNPRALFVVISFGLALLLPTGGHGVEVAGTTPGRFVLAVMPLAALPVAEWLRATGRRPILAAASALLVALSIWNCVAHDLLNQKTTVTMMAAGFSGWNPSMLFPLIHQGSWLPTAFDRTVLIGWIALTPLLVAWGATLADRESAALPGAPARAAKLAVGCLTTLAAVGVLAILDGGPRGELQFLTDSNGAVSEAQAASAGERCWIQLGTLPAPAGGGAR